MIGTVHLYRRHGCRLRQCLVHPTGVSDKAFQHHLLLAQKSQVYVKITVHISRRTIFEDIYVSLGKPASNEDYPEKEKK